MNHEATTNGASDPRPPTKQSVTVAIDPVALVVTECITVTSAMRKHARWAHSSVSAILGGGGSRSNLSENKSEHNRGDSTSSSLSQAADDGLLTGRWGLRGKKGSSMQDNPLLSAFARLRSDLKGCKGTKKRPDLRGGSEIDSLQVYTRLTPSPSYIRSCRSFDRPLQPHRLPPLPS